MSRYDRVKLRREVAYWSWRLLRTKESWFWVMAWDTALHDLEMRGVA